MQRVTGSYLADDPFLLKTKPKRKKGDFKVSAVPKRTFQHKIEHRRFKPDYRFAAANITNLQTILSPDQQLQCADAYTNNGIVRGAIDRSVFFIQGERTGFVVEPNDEITETATDQEAKDLNEQIANDTLTVTIEGYPDQPARIKELKRKCHRLNKRVKLHNRIEQFLTSCLVFGRNGLEIVRLPATESWPQFGEPMALKHLSSRKIQDVEMDSQTHDFNGLFYDSGDIINPIKFIPSRNLIVGFHDDNNLYENTNYSGTSAIWPILSVSQTDDVINDEDMPEGVRNLGHGFGFIYGGTNNEQKLEEIEQKIADKTWLVHGNPELTADVKFMSRDLMELPNVRTADGKYICQCLNLPLFLMYEDTANFATANQVMQVYKAGILKRYRTWLQGILEDYWYDTILADHLNIELKDVIASPIKIKATFADINFETRSEIIAGDKELVAMDVWNRSDVAKDLDRKDIAQRIEEEEAQAATIKAEAVMNRLNQIEAQQQQQQGFDRRTPSLGSRDGDNTDNQKVPIPQQQQQQKGGSR